MNSRIGTLNSPFVGEFKNGRGELFSPDTLNGKAIIVRAVWSNISADAHRYQESYSDDGGKSWKVAFTADKTRVPASEMHTPPPAPHDFDFDLGQWKLHASRLVKPLTGSTKWIELQGTTAVTRIWDGSANLAEVHTEGGPTGPVDFLALRWYSPTARQWFLTFASAAAGDLGNPDSGTFKDGRVDFYGQEPLDGRVILVRFSLWPGPNDTAQSEQAFSADGGHTWEVNYKTTYTRAAGN
jgi:hypothetical protein